MHRIILLHAFAMVMSCAAGCSSLGLSLWPSQFPLLNDTKDLAARSPMPSGLPSELAKKPLDVYYLEPGDRVQIEPVEADSEFRTFGDQKVQIDGSLDLGQFGRLRVAGMPVEAVETAIEERVFEVTGKAEAIGVQLLEPNAALVYVLGEVGSPGAYALDGHETVLDAILTAGGLTSRASPCDIVFVRPTTHCTPRVVLPVCYRQMTQIGDTTTNYQLQPGDRIVVGARTFCEELSFWRQRNACPHCNCEHRVECAPGSREYMNRFIGWFDPFPLPRIIKGNSSSSVSDATDTSADGAAPAQNRSPNREVIPQNRDGLSPAVQDPKADADLFLPPITVPQASKSPAPNRMPASRN